MLRLELEKAAATLRSWSGEKKKGVHRLEMKFSLIVGAELLAYFDPQMPAGFWKEGPPDLLGETRVVRFPNLGYPFGIDGEMGTAELSIDYGVGDNSGMSFEGCKVDAFEFTPKDGGKGVLVFRVSCNHEGHHIRKLWDLLEEGVTITLKPAPLPEMKDAA